MDMNAITTYATRVIGKGLRIQMVEKILDFCREHGEYYSESERCPKCRASEPAVSQRGENFEVRPWQYSVKLEVNAKGWVQPSVHVYSDKADCHEMAVILLERTVKQLRLSGFKVATDIRNGDPPV